MPLMLKNVATEDIESVVTYLNDTHPSQEEAFRERMAWLLIPAEDANAKRDRTRPRGRARGRASNR